MNRNRRKEISKIIEDLKSLDMRITKIMEEESDARYNLPSFLRRSEQYEKSLLSSNRLFESSFNVNLAIEYLKMSEGDK